MSLVVRCRVGDGVAHRSSASRVTKTTITRSVGSPPTCLEILSVWILAFLCLAKKLVSAVIICVGIPVQTLATSNLYLCWKRRCSSLTMKSVAGCFVSCGYAIGLKDQLSIIWVVIVVFAIFVDAAYVVVEGLGRVSGRLSERCWFGCRCCCRCDGRS